MPANTKRHSGNRPDDLASATSHNTAGIAGKDYAVRSVDIATEASRYFARREAEQAAKVDAAPRYCEQCASYARDPISASGMGWCGHHNTGRYPALAACGYFTTSASRGKDF